MINLTAIGVTIAIYLGCLAYMRDPHSLAKKLRAGFWTISKFQNVIKISEIEYVSLTLADYENVPNRYKKYRRIYGFFTKYFINFFYVVTSVLFLGTVGKLWLEWFKADIPAKQFQSYDAYYFLSVAFVIISSLLLVGIYVVFASFAENQLKIDSKGDFLDSD